jgi:ornithine decarboxylase
VKLFVTDSESDLKKLARKAPGSKIFFRILTEGDGADWPLSKKFGSCRPYISAYPKSLKIWS